MASNEGQEAERRCKLASDKSGPDRPVTDSLETGKGVQGSKAEGRDWTQKLLKPSANGEQGSTVEPDLDSWDRDCGEDWGDQPGVRGSLGELTEVSPVVEASSGASPEGNFDLEVGSSMSPGWWNIVLGVMQPRGVQSAEGHWLPLHFSRDLQVGLWSQMRGSLMGPNGQGHGQGL
ncbi:hypothetical protein F5J12DRAFT_781688 [Pisolithus orientalis]|uniref:uncharacterized protein n=1 Tax=Pisolithus orientalis TaxID=936130 RepID=UPI002224C920|nr:uncharacterized protein F5J12DRAFT_781688 [Pisolithus orientalis]KAI6010672.1 hypothetical protein F5J12DRAFT_781688 [Pisolithus orientalis]